MNNNVVELNEANFAREVLGANQPVLVEFWAAWSHAALTVTPVLESVADGAPRPVKVARVNVDDHENLAKKYGVRAVPALLIFNLGDLRDHVVGKITEKNVLRRLERFNSPAAPLKEFGKENGPCEVPGDVFAR